MYACQLMVPCVDSALKSTKSSPRLGAVHGAGRGCELGCAGSQRGACERKTQEGAGRANSWWRSAVLAQFCFNQGIVSFFLTLSLCTQLFLKTRALPPFFVGPFFSPSLWVRFRTKRSCCSHTCASILQPNKPTTTPILRWCGHSRPPSAATHAQELPAGRSRRLSPAPRGPSFSHAPSSMR